MTDKPIVDPDPAKIPDAVGKSEKAIEPFLPAKVRAGIYATAGVVAVVATAASGVVGGTAGDWLGIVGASAAAIGGTTALAHVSR